MIGSGALNALLDRLPRIRVGVVGDFCLDVYWTMDDTCAERSVETGLPTRPVRSQRYSLGGAGNVVSNLLALGVGRVEAVGVIGNDPMGHEMRRLLEDAGAVCSGLFVQDDSHWDTPCYIKPLRNGEEENRLDFGNYNLLNAETGRAMVDHLSGRLPQLDAVIINQQLLAGVHTPAVQALLQALFRSNAGTLFILDARHLAKVYNHCVLKVNDMEAAALCGQACRPGDTITTEAAGESAMALFELRRKPVLVSRGPRGCVVADENGLATIPGLRIAGKVDPVGAGDSMTAGMAAALAAGASMRQAAAFGNFVAGVTVQKLFETGTASPEEVRRIGTKPDYLEKI